MGIVALANMLEAGQSRDLIAPDAEYSDHQREKQYGNAKQNPSDYLYVRLSFRKEKFSILM